MDEEITIINSNTRNEKIRNFFLKNKKNLAIIATIIIIFVIGHLSFDQIKKDKKTKLGNEYNSVVISFNNGQKNNVNEKLLNIIHKRDKTYSPLALFFLIDKELIENKETINLLFDEIINKVDLENEIKNLIIYKKGLFNSEFVDENKLINILKPITNSKSIWKSHALYLLAEYFYSKNEYVKAKEFFSQIMALTNANSAIKLETEKRLNRDFGE
tara:strand:+ start:276 stop:920 length:645 start_codon:yes stop_codon:yes gene_type:complete